MRLVQVAVFSAFCFGITAPAMAQLSGDGGPIRLKADRSEVLDRERKVILIDDVDITQGTARLRANVVTLAYTGSGGAQTSGLASGFGEIDTMTAQGDVFYITPDLKANGELGIYNAATDTITLTGNVVLVRGDDVAKGERLTVQLADGKTVLDGAVNMVIIPNEGEDQ